MRAHIHAVQALLEPLGWPVHLVGAPESAAMPYVLLWASAGVPVEERSECGPGGEFTDALGVTAVAGTPDGVWIVQEAVRGVLSPGGRTTRHDVDGDVMWLALFDSRAVQIDRDVTITGTNRHPAFGVDLYRLTSTPA